MRRKGMRYSAAVGFLSLLLSGAAAADYEYNVSPTTYLLLHFNGGLKLLGQGEEATAEIFGGGKLVEGGWRDGAFDPGADGGLLIQTDRPLASKYAHVTLEAWVYLRAYPKERGYIFHKVYESENNEFPNRSPVKSAFGLSLFVDKDGRIGNTVRSIFYGAKREGNTFWSDEGYKLPLNKWVHVAVANAGFPVGKYTMFAEYKPVHRVAHEYGHRIAPSGEKENTNGKIIIGNNAERNAPFPGLIDEARILMANLDVQPPADISWTDPEKKRPLVPDGKALLEGTQPLAYMDCDAPEATSLHPADKWTVAFDGGTFKEGVRGKSYAGGTVSVQGKGIVTGKEGAIEFWILPEDWNNKLIRNHGLLNIGKRTYLILYIFNCQSEMPPLSLYYKNDKNENQFIHAPIFLRDMDWHHIALVWKGPEYTIYHNGAVAASGKMRESDRVLYAVQDYVNFEGGKGEKTTRFDEIRIFDRALTPSEVWNSFARYRHPEQMKQPLPYVVRLKNYPSREALLGDVRILGVEQPASVRLTLRQNGRTVAGEPMALAEDATWAKAWASTAELSPGPYEASLQFLDAGGGELRRVTETREKKTYPWLHAGLGVPATVPPPWVPLEAEGKTVRCLLTRYDFGLGLLKQATTQGGRTLAGAAQLRAFRDGKETDLDGEGRIRLRENGVGAIVEKRYVSGALHMDARARMDFDGYIPYRITLRAEGEPVTLQRLRFEIPFRDSEALDYYVLGEHMDHMADAVPAEDGVFWESRTGRMFKRHELPEYGAMQRPRSAMAAGSFVPYAWLGNRHRGLCYMADSDEGWAQNPMVPALELERKGRVVWLRLNLIADPVTLEPGRPREIAFSLMATPTKRPAPGWRQWTTDSFYPITEAGRVLDDSIFYVPYPVDYGKAADFFAKRKQERGTLMLPYMDFYGSDSRMEPSVDFRWEWWPDFAMDALPRKASIYRTYYGTGSVIDWYLHNFRRYVEAGADGIYIDNIYPSPLFDLEGGPAYRLPDGRIQPGYQLSAMREFFKRIYCLMAGMQKPRPYLMPHMTHCMIGPVLSFADIAYEGEDHYIHGDGENKRNEEGADHITYWANRIVRVIDQPQAWGSGVHWLEAVRGHEENWKLERSKASYVRAWQTQLLLHDSGQAGARGEAFAAWLGDTPEIDFVPYRENRAIEAAPVDKIYVSYYRKGEDHLLVVVGNHAQEDRAVSLRLDTRALGVAKPVLLDGETGEPVEGDGARLPLTVKARDYRLLRIEPAGGE